MVIILLPNGRPLLKIHLMYTWWVHIFKSTKYLCYIVLKYYFFCQGNHFIYWQGLYLI